MPKTTKTRPLRTKAKKKAASAVPVKNLPPSRLVISKVSPEVDGGQYFAKGAMGRDFEVEAVLICDGHDRVKGDLLYRHESERKWSKVPLSFFENDRFQAVFPVDKYGAWHYTVEASIDRFATWRDGFFKKLGASEPVRNEMQTGLMLMKELIRGIRDKNDKDWVRGELKVLEGLFNNLKEERTVGDREAARGLLYGQRLEDLFHVADHDPSHVKYEKELTMWADSELAEFSAWYEFFPRSQWEGIAEEGNFRDCAQRLEYIADLGFNVVYFPPIHPIGEKFRKGKNNALQAQPDDVGSPWAIGSKLGGHKAIHPDLGTEKDFTDLIGKARSLGIEIALDIAIQCSPDHPYLKANEEWFIHRPDGTIQYAENPPKKYQDIYPLNFECEEWQDLWDELLSIFEYWIRHGVRVFRVDNPHTKAFHFWEWLIKRVRENHPEVILLAEAFTRPHIMQHLGKIGYHQSYTYFAWRNTKEELTDYMTELTKGPMADYFRPNFWPNTPDIFTETLQNGGRAAYINRFVLAATLSSNYGIYGPAYELMEGLPKEIGREDYFHSEKYEVRYWEVNSKDSIAPLIKTVNTARRENPALQSNRNLFFHPVDNDQVMAYSKQTDDRENLILVVVNLDCYNKQAGMVDIQMDEVGLDPKKPYEVHDLLTGNTFLWHGGRNYVELDPQGLPAHIFRVTQV